MTCAVLAEVKISIALSVFSESALFDRVNIEGVLTHLSDVKQQERDGKILTVRTGVIHNHYGFGDISFFDSFVNMVCNEKSCGLTQVSVA